MKLYILNFWFAILIIFPIFDSSETASLGSGAEDIENSLQMLSTL
jgi:hypothetical protein